jgi:hypothetical protein
MNSTIKTFGHPINCNFDTMLFNVLTGEIFATGSRDVLFFQWHSHMPKYMIVDLFNGESLNDAKIRGARHYVAMHECDGEEVSLDWLKGDLS